VDTLLKVVASLFAMEQELKIHGLCQVCKFIKFGPIEEMDFLSCHFFWDSNYNVRMTRIPARVFQSISWSLKIPDNLSVEAQHKLALELCFSKGMCLLAWASGLSIFETLGKKMVELGVSGKATEYNKYTDKCRVWSSGKDDHSAYNGYLINRYGLTEDAINDIESSIRSIKSIEDTVQIPALQALFWTL